MMIYNICVYISIYNDVYVHVYRCICTVAIDMY